jgi:predicted nucleic acid-binding protein
MFVVADTAPLNYLILIGQIELLSSLYDKIVIPHAVFVELQHSRTPALVRAWVLDLPNWCAVRQPVSTPDAMLNQLDAGERDAIQLALELGIDTLLMDEIKGRREAQKRSLKVVGTLTILETAAQLGWIDFRINLDRLENAGFRLSGVLRSEFLMRNLRTE